MSSGLLTPVAQQLNVIGGDGIDAITLSGTATLAADSTIERNTNKDQIDGYAGLDGAGNINMVGIIPRVTNTIAELEGFTPAIGELGSVNSLPGGLFLGDNDSEWHSVGFGSSTTIMVTALETPDKNWTSFKRAYADAALLTPNGLALSATNRATVFVGPGEYLVDAAFFLIPFVDISGVTGNRPVFVVDGDNNKYLNFQSDDVNITNIYFKSLGTSQGGLRYQGTMAPFKHDNLYFETPDANSPPHYNLTTTTLSSGTRITGCKTNGMGMYGGKSTVFNVEEDVVFEDCEGGNLSFGSSSAVAAAAVNNGTFRRCILNNTGAIWLCLFGGVMEYCSWYAGIGGLRNIERIPEIRFSTIAPPSSALCIDAAASLRARISNMNHKSFAGADTLGVNVVNDIDVVPATAGIIESNGF